MTMLHTVDFLHMMTDIMTTCCFFHISKSHALPMPFAQSIEAAVGTWETSGSGSFHGDSIRDG